MGDGHVDRWMALITANGKLSLLLSIAFKQLTKLQQNEIKIKESPLMNLGLETVDIFCTVSNMFSSPTSVLDPGSNQAEPC